MTELIPTNESPDGLFSGMEEDRWMVIKFITYKNALQGAEFLESNPPTGMQVNEVLNYLDGLALALRKDLEEDDILGNKNQ